jgi:hypothetical protein
MDIGIAEPQLHSSVAQGPCEVGIPSAETAPGKQRGRPFQKGTSGNPAGRPRGARHRATVLAEKLMEEDVAKIVASVISAAKAGDMTAARVVLDRLVPVPKDRPICISLPKLETSTDAMQQFQIVPRPKIQPAICFSISGGGLEFMRVVMRVG